MSRVIGCAFCECDIEGMHHDDDCPNHPDNLEPPDAAPPKEGCTCPPLLKDGDRACDWCVQQATQRLALTDKVVASMNKPPPSDAAPVAPSDEAKLAFIKAHTAVMGEWEITDGWEKALGAGLRAYDAVNAHPLDAAPVAGALAVALADGFRNMGGDGSGDDVSHPANWPLGAWVLYAIEVQKLLYAHPRPDNEDAQPDADLIVDLATLLERRFTPHKAMTLASSILAHPEDAPE